MAIKRFEDIEAWKAALELAQAIYRLMAQGKFAQDFGLPYTGAQTQQTKTTAYQNLVHIHKLTRSRLSFLHNFTIDQAINSRS